jgi:hypothetical protein
VGGSARQLLPLDVIGVEAEVVGEREVDPPAAQRRGDLVRLCLEDPDLDLGVRVGERGQQRRQVQRGQRDEAAERDRPWPPPRPRSRG